MNRVAAMRGITIGNTPHGGLFTLPLDAATQTFGILAKRRVGKTYTAKVMAEEFAACGVPFVALDPTGAWWGLRSSADGSKPGIPVVILGGEHGDVPLERTGGKVAADLVVDHPGFYVIDLVSFESGAAQDQFATEFLGRLYYRKAKSPTPMHLFIDEADSFAPQRPGPNQLRMLGATEALVRRGGIRGIGTTLISQRAAVVNKNVLTQLDCLIALQVTGPQDQAAIRDWVKQDGTPEQVTTMMGSLASLGRGEAWVWSPGWLEKFERVSIREGRTFNSSATPEVGKAAVVPTKLAPVDLDAVREAMAATIEKQKADDPKELRRQIAELQRDIANERRAVSSLEGLKHQEPEVRIERVEVPIITPDDHVEMRGYIEAGRKAAAEFTDAVRRVEALLKDESAAQVAAGVLSRFPRPQSPQVARLDREDARSRRGRTPDRVILDDLAPDPVEGVYPVYLKAGARKMLDVLARHHPLVVTRPQLGALVGMAHSGGTFSTYLSVMKRAGFIELAGREVRITAAGLAEAGVSPGNPMTADEIRETWRRTLKAGARAMFDVLTGIYPDAISREELGQRTDISPSGGTFGTYLSILRRNGLVETDGGAVRATDVALGLTG